jgi:N-acetylneuraminic acid mutarotase
MHLAVLAVALLACGSNDTNEPSGSGGGSAGAGGGTGSTNAGSGGSLSGGGSPTPGWYDLAPLPEPLQENAVVGLGDEVVVIGGFNQFAQVVDRVEAYAPATDSWRSLAPLPAARHHVNAAVADDTLYALGSLVGLNFGAAGDVWAYDAPANAWSPRASMPAGSERGGAATASIGSIIYVAGGYRGGDAVSDFSAYDTVADSWQMLPPLPTARDHLVAGVRDGLFHAVGGRDGSIGGIDGRVDVFDPETGSWSSAPTMLTPRGGAAAATLPDGRIVVLGGEGNTNDPSGVFAEVEALSPNSNWVALDPMTTPRHGTGAVTLDGIIYMPGGATTQAFGAVDVVQAYVPD